MCTAPDIKNAEIVGSQQPNYRINSKIQYKCSPGFEPEQSVQITCNSQAQWTVIKQCTGILQWINIFPLIPLTIVIQDFLSIFNQITIYLYIDEFYLV